MSIRGKQTREKILCAAREIFAAKGFTSVTMKDICLATGLSRGGLYEHYASTAEIFRDVFASLADPQSDFISDSIREGKPAVQILDALFAVFDREMKEKEASLSLALIEYADTCDKSYLQDMHKKSVARWKTLLDYGMKTGEFAKIDSRTFISLLLYAYQGVRICNRFLDDRELVSAILPTLRNLLIPEQK